jgi:nucleoside-diphosphate-sugar epimerase
MRIVVIGASGNVGTSLLHALGEDPAVESVLGIARRRPVANFPKTEWATADVARDDLVPHLRGADAVVHLAWAIQPSRDLDALWLTNVHGSGRVFDAVAAAGVPTLVYASSVGAYSPGPKDRAVPESWATGGIPTSFYARHKAEVERRLDRFEAEHPEIRVVRLRPGLIFKRGAASGIRRLFAGPFLPSALVRPSLLPIVPSHPRLRFQAVHSLDVGDAYRLAVTRDVRGAFNVAADPVLDGRELARILGARAVPVPAGLLRGAAALTWRLRLQPTPPGWVDLALGVPILDTTRAREELGWSPRYNAEEALLELLDGIRDGAGVDTPPLSPRTGGPLRSRELATRVGGEDDAA